VKKLMFLVILILSGIIMYQGGCFDDFDFYYGVKMLRILEGEEQ
jgi:hypothetical protein